MLVFRPALVVVARCPFPERRRIRSCRGSRDRRDDTFHASAVRSRREETRPRVFDVSLSELRQPVLCATAGIPEIGTETLNPKT
jgi:hypothetical protein|eukprot:14303-Pelagococcus_subviridis.AAC.2